MEPNALDLELGTQLADESPCLSPRPLIRDPISGATLYAATAALVGVLFLMTNKPSFSISVVAVALPTALGVAAGLISSR